MVTVDSSNLGVAFGLVIAAGAAIPLGSSVVYFPKFIKFASPKMLSASLGLSAGVMTYISLVDLFKKSISAFVDAGNDSDKSYLYATLGFFGGVIMVQVRRWSLFLMSSEYFIRKHSLHKNIDFFC